MGKALTCSEIKRVQFQVNISQVVAPHRVALHEVVDVKIERADACLKGALGEHQELRPAHQGPHQSRSNRVAYAFDGTQVRIANFQSPSTNADTGVAKVHVRQTFLSAATCDYGDVLQHRTGGQKVTFQQLSKREPDVRGA